MPNDDLTFSYCPVCIHWPSKDTDPPKVEEVMPDGSLRYHHHQCCFALRILEGMR